MLYVYGCGFVQIIGFVALFSLAYFT